MKYSTTNWIFYLQNIKSYFEFSNMKEFDNHNHHYFKHNQLSILNINNNFLSQATICKLITIFNKIQNIY